MTDPGGEPEPVENTSLTVRVGIDPADRDLAERLGWEEGVPGAQVHLLRNGTRIWRVAETDATGKVVFDKVLAGLHRLYATRRLSSDEAGAIGEAERAFGDGRTFMLGTEREIELELYADRAGDLVISEIGYGKPPAWELPGAAGKAALFFELYNNSDRTLFLDGLVYGLGQPADSDGFNSCADTELPRTDPAGIYGRFFLAFPGSGSEHPIGPGEIRVVAMQAADHTPLHPAMPDLSGADFEIGSSDLGDNPSVPNMRDVGLEPLSAGANWTYLLAVSDPYFVADPIEPAALPIAWRDQRGNGYVKVVREEIREVVATANIWPDSDLEYPPCIPMIHPTFDRYEILRHIGFDVDSNEKATKSFQRRVLRIQDGRLILQNTNTSAVDFFIADRTPGRLPS